MCIFQSEQVINLRFWLKNNLADIEVARSQSVGLSCEVQWQGNPVNSKETSIIVLLQLADTLNTQFKYKEESWHSLLKRLKYLRPKVVQRLIRY